MKFKEAQQAWYNEIAQQVNIKFAFANKKEDVITPISYWMLCRDFLSDVLFAEESGKATNIYGFAYNPEENKIDRDKTRFVLNFPPVHASCKDNLGDSLLNNFMDNLPILHKIEKENGLELTNVTNLTKDVCMIEGDKFWLNSTFSLHIYTFLLRCLGYKFRNQENWMEEIKEKKYNEGYYLENMTDKFPIALTKLKEIFEGHDSVTGWGTKSKYYKTDTIHNHGGVFSLFKSGVVAIKNNSYYNRMLEVCNVA